MKALAGSGGAVELGEAKAGYAFATLRARSLGVIGMANGYLDSHLDSLS